MLTVVFLVAPRSSLPVPMFSRNDFSLWSVLKNCIGKELSKITMPVVFNEPLSFLQRMLEYLEYAKLLRLAAEQEDPVMRMRYIAGTFMLITSVILTNHRRPRPRPRHRVLFWVGHNNIISINILNTVHIEKLAVIYTIYPNNWNSFTVCEI